MTKALLFLGMLFNATFLTANTTDWQNYQSQVLIHQKSIEGWCSSDKAKRLMDLIFDEKPEICVEVGVFGGSSIYPTASALKFLQKGQVYAIDPWEHTFCLEGYPPDDPNYVWWSHVDLNKIYLGFLKMLAQFDLEPYCTVMRTTGLQALHYFADETIDILHIDGNHTESSALSDVECYFPKVKKGGYIWLDDTNWVSVCRAKEFLLSTCDKIEPLSTDEYYLFRKPTEQIDEK